MEIHMMQVSKLKPYPNNAKRHDDKQIDNVANSIKRFGWQQPIVIDENGVVVIGHCRLLAAKKLKLQEVPVTVASGLTEDEIRELRIADNKTNESPWEMNLLADDIDGLDFEGFDFDFGFDGEPIPSFDELDADTVPVEHVAIKLTFPDYTAYHRVENRVKEFANEVGATVVVSK